VQCGAVRPVQGRQGRHHCLQGILRPQEEGEEATSSSRHGKQKSRQSEQ